MAANLFGGLVLKVETHKKKKNKKKNEFVRTRRDYAVDAVARGSPFRVADQMASPRADGAHDDVSVRAASSAGREARTMTDRFLSFAFVLRSFGPYPRRGIEWLFTINQVRVGRGIAFVPPRRFAPGPPRVVHE